MELQCTWDDAWKEMQKSMVEQAAQLRPGEESAEEPQDKSWQDTVPKPPAKVSSEEEDRLRAEGFLDPTPEYLIEMLAEEAFRTGMPADEAPKNWFAYISSVDSALAKDSK